MKPHYRRNFYLSRVAIISCSVLLMSIKVWATPPENVELAYDMGKGILTISGKHPTQDRLEHFIRRAVVVINQNEPKGFYTTRQNSANGYEFLVPVQAEAGDKIHVEVYCSQGGSKSVDLDVPRAVSESKPVVMTADDVKALKDQDHQNIPVIP